jgi:hypothetical protein
MKEKILLKFLFIVFEFNRHFYTCFLINRKLIDANISKLIQFRNVTVKFLIKLLYHQ